MKISSRTSTTSTTTKWPRHAIETAFKRGKEEGGHLSFKWHYHNRPAVIIERCCRHKNNSLFLLFIYSFSPRKNLYILSSMDSFLRWEWYSSLKWPVTMKSNIMGDRFMKNRQKLQKIFHFLFPKAFDKSRHYVLFR